MARGAGGRWRWWRLVAATEECLAHDTVHVTPAVGGIVCDARRDLGRAARPLHFACTLQVDRSRGTRHYETYTTEPAASVTEVAMTERARISRRQRRRSLSYWGPTRCCARRNCAAGC